MVLIVDRGLLHEEEGLAARVLESLDITVEEVRAQVARIVGQGDEVTTGQIRTRRLGLAAFEGAAILAAGLLVGWLIWG